MEFKKRDIVEHRLFGGGIVVDVKEEWYEISFLDPWGKRNILKGHSTLMPKGHRWSEEELRVMDSFQMRYEKVQQVASIGRNSWRDYGEKYDDDISSRQIVERKRHGQSLCVED